MIFNSRRFLVFFATGLLIIDVKRFAKYFLKIILPNDQNHAAKIFFTIENNSLLEKEETNELQEKGNRSSLDVRSHVSHIFILTRGVGMCAKGIPRCRNLFDIVFSIFIPLLSLSHNLWSKNVISKNYPKFLT